MTDANESFSFSLTDEEKQYLHELVRLSIAQELKRRTGRGGETHPPPPPSELLTREMGAFVTLKIGGNLRGCIGNVIGNRPLHETVAEMAKNAAFQDPRFPPLQPGEFETLEVEISVLSPLAPCPDPELIEPGRHGLMVRQGGRSGLLLPQVATEHGWDRESFLRHTCGKAGLPAGCWQEPQTQIFWFEAVIF